MNVDSINVIDDCSQESLRQLCDLISQSSTQEHMVYREAELDEVWRVLDLTINDPREAGKDLQELINLRAAIMEVHDLIGVDEDFPAAEARMKTLLK